MLTDSDLMQLLEQLEQTFHDSVDKTTAAETIRNWVIHLKDRFDYEVGVTANGEPAIKRITHRHALLLTLIYYYHYAEGTAILPSLAAMLTKLRLSGAKYFELLNLLKSGGLITAEIMETKIQRNVARLIANLEMPPEFTELAMHIFRSFGAQMGMPLNTRLCMTGYVLCKLSNTPIKFYLIARASHASNSVLTVALTRFDKKIKRTLRIFRPPVSGTTGLDVSSG
jgi:hypothetical protein